MISRILLGVVLALPVPALAASAGGSWYTPYEANVANMESLQRGAKYFINYCLGCHSTKYVRYNRLAEDLGISEGQIVQNLMFTGEEPHDAMEISMPAADAERWFGRTPPDLSLTARSWTPAKIYNYLKTFYVDPQGSQGVNNLTLPGASMPHVLWELEGLKEAVFKTDYEEVKNDDGTTSQVGKEHFVEFRQLTEGTLSGAEYDLMIADIVNYLAYTAEPVRLKRQSLGIKVLLFLTAMFVFAYLLKREIWSDVH